MRSRSLDFGYRRYHDDEDEDVGRYLKRGDVHFHFLSRKYRPLEDEDAKKRNKETYKKIKKNVGRVLVSTWKCLMLGIYSWALSYSTPITAFVPEYHPEASRSS